MKHYSRRKTARHAAIETLCRLEQSKLPLSRIFEEVLTEYRISGVDRQLAMKLCYGVLRRRQYLDQVLTLLCSQPLKKIKPFAYHALHTGLYQLLFLDRIPPSAAVNETVNAVIAAHLPKALQGFVNGVLRQSIRKRSDLPRPDAPGLLNHPQWLTRRWQDNFGEQVMKQICIANNQEPQLCLRVTPGINKSEMLDLFRQNDIPARPGQYAPDAVILEDYQGPITALPGFRHGYFHVQDQAAQLATLLMGPFDNGGRYLDCCAGVGGKTAHLLSLVDSRASSIVALEPHVRRARQFRETISRVAASSLVSFHEQTLEEYSASSSTEFNAILVDAPCSGTGVIGRHPDIRWNRNAHQLEAYHKRQLSLLENAEKLLVPGGIIVYATCSIEPEENYQVISRFLEQYPHYSLTDCQAYLPSQAHPLIRHGCFAPLPTAEIDGFFAARLTSARQRD